MLYFSKLKLVTIYLIIIFLSFFSFTNFFESNYLILSKKVNLGLDLQGGSYLLLEVDSGPIIKQNLQSKLIYLRKSLKEQKIKYKNLKITNEKISFEIIGDKVKEFENFFLNKDNSINVYYPDYKSYEMDHFIKGNSFTISYLKL